MRARALAAVLAPRGGLRIPRGVIFLHVDRKHVIFTAPRNTVTPTLSMSMSPARTARLARELPPSGSHPHLPRLAPQRLVQVAVRRRVERSSFARARRIVTRPQTQPKSYYRSC